LRDAAAAAAADRGSRITSGCGHADSQPDARRRVLHHAGHPARGRSQDLVLRQAASIERTPMPRSDTRLLAAAAVAAAVTLAAPLASAEDASTTSPAETTAKARPPTSATPEMIAEAIAR